MTTQEDLREEPLKGANVLMNISSKSSPFTCLVKKYLQENNPDAMKNLNWNSVIEEKLCADSPTLTFAWCLNLISCARSGKEWPLDTKVGAYYFSLESFNANLSDEFLKKLPSSLAVENNKNIIAQMMTQGLFYTKFKGIPLNAIYFVGEDKETIFVVQNFGKFLIQQNLENKRANTKVTFDESVNKKKKVTDVKSISTGDTEQVMNLSNPSNSEQKQIFFGLFEFEKKDQKTTEAKQPSKFSKITFLKPIENYNKNDKALSVEAYLVLKIKRNLTSPEENIVHPIL